MEEKENKEKEEKNDIDSMDTQKFVIPTVDKSVKVWVVVTISVYSILHLLLFLNWLLR